MGEKSSFQDFLFCPLLYICYLQGKEMDDNQQSSETSDRSDLVSENGKNSKSIVCQRCGSKVLCVGTAVLAEKEVKCHDETTNSYKLLPIPVVIHIHFWIVPPKDMRTFLKSMLFLNAVIAFLCF